MNSSCSICCHFLNALFHLWTDSFSICLVPRHLEHPTLASPATAPLGSSRLSHAHACSIRGDALHANCCYCCCSQLSAVNLCIHKIRRQKQSALIAITRQKCRRRTIVTKKKTEIEKKMKWNKKQGISLIRRLLNAPLWSAFIRPNISIRAI